MTTPKHNFDDKQPTFYGEGYLYDRDQIRLTKQLQKVYDCLKDEKWYTLADLEAFTSTPEASASAAIRSLRRPENGGYHIERRYLRRGLHEYRLDHKKPSNWQPKNKPKPKDIIKVGAEHAIMTQALNNIIAKLNNRNDIYDILNTAQGALDQCG